MRAAGQKPRVASRNKGRAFKPERLTASFAATPPALKFVGAHFANSIIPIAKKFPSPRVSIAKSFHRQQIVNRIANILAIDQPTSQCR
jgi:hypothetical protein